MAARRRRIDVYRHFVVPESVLKRFCVICSTDVMDQNGLNTIYGRDR